MSHNYTGSRRVRVIALLVLAVWGVLAGRLLQLHFVHRTEFAGRASRQRMLTVELPARPGEILDRNGRVLATSITSKSLYVVPSQIDDAWKTSLALSEALQLDTDQLFERLCRLHNKHFVWVKRRLDIHEEEAIRKLELPSSCWGFRDEFQRRYPQEQLAAHVLGLRDIDGHGQGGVEQTFDEVLSGHAGHQNLIRDARGRVIDRTPMSTDPPRPGKSVVLTIDAVIQHHAEHELDRLMADWKPLSACAIAMDPATGELLAVASRPTFDPNQPGDAAEESWKNVAVASIFEPGSTFKPFVVAWALEKGLLKMDETFNCENGEYRMGRRLLHDHHPYGVLSVTDILVKSSNIGMAKIGERMTNRELFNAAVAFGMGRRTGIDLPGEVEGMLRPLEKWNSYSTGSIPMGQELAVTPIQLITAHAALANGGMLLKPQLILQNDSAQMSKTILQPNESMENTLSIPETVRSVASSNVVTPIVSADVARGLVTGAMREVVRRGTGRKAELKGYAVFGKTGTAQKIEPDTGKYSEDRHICSFICGAPADHPRLLVLVVANEPTTGPKPYFGGTVAAPAAAEILQKSLEHLHVPVSDKPERTALNPDEIAKPL